MASKIKGGPHKLRVVRSDAPVDLRREVLRLAQGVVAALVEGKLPIKEEGAGKVTWDKHGGKWDAVALQRLTNLLQAKLPRPMNVAAGHDLSTVVKYQKGTLIIFSCTAFKLLVYRSVTAMGFRGEQIKLAAALAQEEDVAARPDAPSVAVRVLEALPDDDDATQLAVRALAQVKLNTSADDPESSSHDIALERANALKDALSRARGVGWHVVLDNKPVVASVLSKTRIVLQRAKFTFIAYHHIEPDPTLTETLLDNLGVLKFLGFFLCAMVAAVYWLACPRVAPGTSLHAACGVLDRNGYYLITAVVVIYVYLRVLKMAGLKFNRRQAAAAVSA